MMFWRLLHAQIAGGRLRLVLTALVVGWLMAVVVIGLAEQLAPHPLFSLPAGLAGALIAIAGVQLGQVWISQQAGGWLTVLTQRLRRRLLTLYLDLEPAALPADHLRAAMTALPRRLASLRARVPLAVSSLAGALACMAATLAMVPAAGLALLLVVKVQSLFLLAEVPWLRASARAARAGEAAIDAALGELLNGFKEALLDPARMAALGGASVVAAQQIRSAARAPFRARLATREALVHATRLMAVAAVAAALLLFEERGDEQGAAMLAIVFMIPLGWLNAIPLLASASTASERIARVEFHLQAIAARLPASPPALVARESGTFLRLELRDVVHRYPARPGAPGAVLGPVSFGIGAGRLTFVTGGNGGGKSTLLHLLSGSLAPEAGAVLVDGLAIDTLGLRDMAAFVPARPVLFEHFPVEQADPDEVREMLIEFRLESLVRFENGRIAARELSVAHRKRVALIGAVLLRRPILLLDEWAADQDPPMRRHFYRTVLPRLRAAGMAVVAVTQDESYFDAADEIVRLDNGARAG